MISGSLVTSAWCLLSLKLKLIYVIRIHFVPHIKDRDYLEDLGVDGRIILKCILEKWEWGGGGAWTGSILLKIGTGSGLL